MKFRIKGADRRTGRDVVREYEAKTPESAAAFANLDGLMVAEVELSSGHSDEAAARTLPSAEALPYRTPTTGSAQAPTYAGLSVASVVLRIYAIICYVLGFLVLAAASIALAMSVTNGGGGVGGAWTTGVFAMVSMLTPGIALLLAAAVAHGLSAACVALRDIARNSWR